MKNLAISLITTGLASTLAAQTLTVPEMLNFAGTGSTTAGFPTAAAGGRVQWCYDTTHFTNAGVTGPITINRLRMRAADGHRNPGGQAYTGVTVQLGNAAVDHASVVGAYASNRGVMGPVSSPMSFSLLPVEGTVPNGYLLDIDLAAVGASFTYDPTSGSDLLIEFVFPSGALPTTNMPAVSTSNVAGQRARRISGTLAGPGTTSVFGAVMEFDFAGPGGYTAPNASRVVSVGAACGATAQSFYQIFGNEDIDLQGGPSNSLLLTPNDPLNPTSYTVTSGTTAVDVSPAALGAGAPDISDEGVVSHTPGFTFNFPGGSTTTIAAAVNGYVWLGGSTASDFSPTVAEVLNQPARLIPFWNDHHAGRNTTTHPGSGLYVNTDTSGGPGNAVTYVTWKEIGEWWSGTIGTNNAPGFSVNTFQVAIFENGNVEYRYGTFTGWRRGTGIVGFARGGTVAAPAVDPGSRDLSDEVPFATAPESGTAALRLSVNVRPSLTVPTGTTLIHTLSNMNAATTAQAFVVLSFAQQAPGTALPLGGPGCLLGLGGSFIDTLSMSAVLPGTTFTDGGILLPLGTSPNAGGLMGVDFFTQGITLDWDGANWALYSSNTLKHTLGLL